MLKWLIMFLILGAPLASAKVDEIMPDMTEKTLVPLNDELRKLGNDKADQDDFEAVETRVDTLEAAAMVWTTVEDSDTTDNTTASASYVDTDLSITFTPGAAGLCVFDFSGEDDSAMGGSGRFVYGLDFDGAKVAEIGMTKDSAGTDGEVPLSMSYSTQCTAASHTVKIQFKSSSGTATMNNDSVTGRLHATHLT